MNNLLLVYVLIFGAIFQLQAGDPEQWQWLEGNRFPECLAGHRIVAMSLFVNNEIMAYAIEETRFGNEKIELLWLYKSIGTSSLFYDVRQGIKTFVPVQGSVTDSFLEEEERHWIEYWNNQSVSVSHAAKNFMAPLLPGQSATFEDSLVQRSAVQHTSKHRRVKSAVVVQPVY